MIAVIGWVGTIGVLAAYASGGVRRFDWANALLWLPVALPALVAGAYSTAALNFAFGVIGTVHLIKHRKEAP